MQREIRVYTSGPMEGLTEDEQVGWRNRFKSILVSSYPHQACPFKVLHPTDRKFTNGDYWENWAEIVEADKDDIRSAQVLMVRLSQPSYGTPMEMLYAKEHEKMIVVWDDRLDVTEPINPWVKYHSTMIVSNMIDAVEAIRKRFRL